MKCRISFNDGEAEIELMPETTIDRDLLIAAVGTATDAKVKRNGTTVFTLTVTKTAIGRAATGLDGKTGDEK